MQEMEFKGIVKTRLSVWGACEDGQSGFWGKRNYSGGLSTRELCSYVPGREIRGVIR